MSEETPTRGAVDLSDQKGVQWDFRDEMSYGGYLDLDRLLGAQHPRTEEHDEVLFILIHQISELWMKLSLHELSGALAAVQQDDLSRASKVLSRVKRIQISLKQAWDVLSTMTPADYLSFRASLGSSSGFQSHQYRLLEFSLGNKNRKMVEVHRHDEKVFARLERSLNSRSIYDEVLLLLSRRGLDIPADRLERDWSEPYRSSDQVEAAWLQVYREPRKHWDLYELAETLVDIEDAFQQWRFRHVTTVERIIGFKHGTGGTSGVSYLKRALDLRFFPELWSLRTSL